MNQSVTATCTSAQQIASSKIWMFFSFVVVVVFSLTYNLRKPRTPHHSFRGHSSKGPKCVWLVSQPSLLVPCRMRSALLFSKSLGKRIHSRSLCPFSPSPPISKSSCLGNMGPSERRPRIREALALGSWLLLDSVFTNTYSLEFASVGWTAYQWCQCNYIQDSSLGLVIARDGLVGNNYFHCGALEA